MADLIRELETAFAAEAAAHARATAALNSLSEAEALELGRARAVYCGSFSSVHGVIGLGLDGPVEDRDLAQIEAFFARKERPAHYWICPATDSSLREFLGKDFREETTQRVHARALAAESPFSAKPLGTSTPDFKEWTIAFARADNPKAKEPSLLSFTKIHQRETRFYLSPESASYTFFSQGIALVPNPGDLRLLALQWNEAKDFGAKVFATLAPSALPLLYERKLFFPV